MGLGAGLAGAAAIGAVGSLGSGLLQSGAAKSAAQAQEQGSTNAINFESNMLGVANKLNQPFYNAGQSVLPTLQGLLTPGTAASTLSSLPGFQFTSKWGTKQTQNALAAEGLGGSTGPLSQAISQYNTGLAQQYYGNYVNQLQQEQSLGQTAAGQVTGSAMQAGQVGANALTNAGNAAAAGTLGSANALSNGLTGSGSSISNSLLLNSLLGGNRGLYGLNDNALYGKFAGAGLV